MGLAAVRASVGVGSVLDDPHRLADDLHLLNDARVGERLEPAPTVRAAIQSTGANGVDLLRRKRRSLAAGMARLTADPPLLPARGRRGLGRLDGVTGRRPGRVRGVFRQHGDLGRQVSDLSFQRRDPLVALAKLCFQFSDPSPVPLLAGRFYRPLLERAMQVLVGRIRSGEPEKNR